MGGYYMNEESFGERLAQLRMQKNVSAREMSLAIGQNEGYINRIENGKHYPSMTFFLYICDYLGVSPKEFFDFENPNPALTHKIMNNLKKLNQKQLESIDAIIQTMTES